MIETIQILMSISIFTVGVIVGCRMDYRKRCELQKMNEKCKKRLKELEKLNIKIERIKIERK